MEIHHVEYKGSFPSVSKCPEPKLPEYAFIGRSNVGKSSLINMLCGRNELAHTSKKPGKTQSLNFYLVDENWFIVDLPGYGYAKTSKVKRLEWQKMIRGYLIKRPTLQCAFVLIDANIPPQEIDVQFINFLGEMGIPFMIAYTKTDRPKPQELEENIEKIQSALLQHWNQLPRQFITSANLKTGREEILEFIQETNAKALHE
jgi:GTP-binding protein